MIRGLVWLRFGWLIR